MQDLRSHLERCLRGRLCLMGLGSIECGDDGFGIRLAEALREIAVDRPGSEGVSVVVAGTSPERFVGQVVQEGADHLIFLDAVDISAPPGAVTVMETGEMGLRFPQVSTHRLSLGLLSRWVEGAGDTKAWLVGVQPVSLRPSRRLTPPVEAALEVLRATMRDVVLSRRSERARSGRLAAPAARVVVTL